MALGDTLYRGPRDARDALLVGNIDAAVAAIGPESAAASMLREGRTSDALTLLERDISPKWSSLRACEKAYRKAMEGRK
jgi:hypothetical protein